ncbi:hypothetical protein DNTS_022159 [Danionella cerebrum]|uniref:Cathepsin O n=1 Tax=Danionella cerebrum TaxID=2873325 RepID=A0A553QGH6_9TELE|nr:hypothetical protein DNTS_022159 [Danionella translucida]
MAFSLVLSLFIISLSGISSVEVQGSPTVDEDLTFLQGDENIDFHQEQIYFRRSLKRQAFLNSQQKKTNHSAKYAVNQFSHLSPKQFKERYLTSWAETAPKFDPSSLEGLFKSNFPPKFDWRDHGVVGAVRNQGACGGCWAFSVVEAIETMCAIEGGKLQQLSVQQVIDCSYENKGCNGGSPVGTLIWLSQTRLKLVSEAEYPFKGVDGMCQIFPQAHAGVALRNSSTYDFSGQEEAMKNALVQWGPLVVIVDAVSWQDYMGGIIQHHCSSHRANHAVLIIGYDTTGEVPYWIVRNSWGTSWGDGGYVYVKLGSDMCGIAESVTAVTVLR